MPRNLVLVALFVLAVVLATAVSAWVAWRGVAGALESEFEQRVGRIAATAAHEIGAADFADARLRAEGGGYLALEVQLVTLRASTGVANAVLLDSAAVTVVDARESGRAEGRVSALDTLAGPALRRALAGTPSVSPPYGGPGGPLRAGFAPVLDSAGRVLGAVAVEAAPAYPPVVARLGRTLALIALVTALALLLLAAVIVRASRAAARLERRLSRAENLAAMGRLTATLAHEIKNPLAVIRGSAQRLGRLEPEAARMAGFVVEEADRLSRTVARYLDFARGTRGGEPGPGEEAGDAVAALGATLDLLEGELRARQVVPLRSAHRGGVGTPRPGGGAGAAGQRVLETVVLEPHPERAGRHAEGRDAHGRDRRSARAASRSSSPTTARASRRRRCGGWAARSSPPRPPARGSGSSSRAGWRRRRAAT